MARRQLLARAGAAGEQHGAPERRRGVDRRPGPAQRRTDDDPVLERDVAAQVADRQDEAVADPHDPRGELSQLAADPCAVDEGAVAAVFVADPPAGVGVREGAMGARDPGVGEQQRGRAAPAERQPGPHGDATRGRTGVGPHLQDADDRRVRVLPARPGRVLGVAPVGRHGSHLTREGRPPRSGASASARRQFLREAPASLPSPARVERPRMKRERDRSRCAGRASRARHPPLASATQAESGGRNIHYYHQESSWSAR